MLRFGNDVERITLTDIRAESPSTVGQFWVADVVIDFSGIEASLPIHIERSDFEEFLSNLKKLNESLDHQFTFANIEGDFKMDFEPDENGSIVIMGYLRNRDFSAAIHFETKTDQSYLPQLINDLREIL